MSTDLFESLKKADNATLEALMLQGERPTRHDLALRQFDGYNTDKFAQTMGALFGARKFRKGFYLEKDMLKGYNIKMQQNSLGEQWLVDSKKNGEHRHGFFDIHEATDFYENAVLLDYTQDKRNSLFDGKFLNDYLVKLDDGVFLGKAFALVFGKRVFASYFVLKEVR